LVGAMHLAAAGAALIPLAALPLGSPPQSTPGWIGLLLLGALTGSLSGWLLGRWTADGQIPSGSNA